MTLREQGLVTGATLERRSGLRLLSSAAARASLHWLLGVQEPSGMIPWFSGGHADPWNHVEGAMALAAYGEIGAAEAAYAWLASTQRADGAWHSYYLATGVEDERLDTNISAYVAVGVWHHYLLTADREFLHAMWPVVEAAIDFALSLQQPGGEILWSLDRFGVPSDHALLTGCSSIYLSLSCALATAAELRLSRRRWERSARRLRKAIAEHPENFADRSRYAMDWYYPVLSGALGLCQAEQRIDSGWSQIVVGRQGVRCVTDQLWVTTAETAECALALLAIGRYSEAAALLSSVEVCRREDGAYLTGVVYPEQVSFPAGEVTSYSVAAILLAYDALGGPGRSAFCRLLARTHTEPDPRSRQ
jgi:hypothetical protein